ncbi:MAG: bactofilin family protein [Acidobacteriota bacterium]
MWKKDEQEQPQVPQPVRPVVASVRPEPASRPQPGGEKATIGRSIAIRGDVTGDEDLVIQGHVEGTVDLKQHSVTVGPEGKVKADISGREVTVEGEVTGNLRADEHVVLRSTAKVEGDLTAPGVVIEDGAVFRGRIDMKEPADKGQRPKPVPAPPPPVANASSLPAASGSTVKESAKS